MVQRLANQFRHHPLVQSRPAVKQFVKFSLVGVVNTATSVSVYLVMSRPAGLDPLIANAIAFMLAVTVSYNLNKRWTFRDQQRAFVRQYSRFFLISLIGLGLSEVIIYAVHRALGVHDLIAFFTAVGVVMFWNFLANKFWTFREVASHPLASPSQDRPVSARGAEAPPQQRRGIREGERGGGDRGDLS